MEKIECYIEEFCYGDGSFKAIAIKQKGSWVVFEVDGDGAYYDKPVSTKSFQGEKELIKFLETEKHRANELASVCDEDNYECKKCGSLSSYGGFDEEEEELCIHCFYKDNYETESDLDAMQRKRNKLNREISKLKKVTPTA